MERLKELSDSVGVMAQDVSTKLVSGWQVSASTVPSHDEIVEQSKLLCLEYVTNKMKKMGISHKKLPIITTTTTDVSQELQNIGSELERMYPDLYRNICRQLNITLTSEDVVRKTYFMFAEQLCKNDIHWGKVVALYAMAGGFAVECVQQGHPEYVHKLVDAFGSFVSKHLVVWIARQGGWVIPDVIRNFNGAKDYTWFWALSAFGAFLGFVMFLLATITL